jgi:hypothetical protein
MQQCDAAFEALLHSGRAGGWEGDVAQLFAGSDVALMTLVGSEGRAAETENNYQRGEELHALTP